MPFARSLLTVSALLVVLCIDFTGITNFAFAQVSQGLPPVLPTNPIPAPSAMPAARIDTPTKSEVDNTTSTSTTRTTASPGINSGTNTNPAVSTGRNFGAGASCLNCGTIIGINESHRRPRPLWMSSTTIDRATPGRSIGSPAPDSSSASGARPIIKPLQAPNLSDGALAQANRDQDNTLRRKLTFETTIQMNNGSIKVLSFDSRPAYNIGSRVKVIGSMLMPN